MVNMDSKSTSITLSAFWIVAVAVFRDGHQKYVFHVPRTRTRCSLMIAFRRWKKCSDCTNVQYDMIRYV